jgi:hypothetical protein
LHYIQVTIMSSTMIAIAMSDVITKIMETAIRTKKAVLE